MTIKAQAHIQRLDLLHFDHLVNAAMAADATHSGLDVRLVVEEHVSPARDAPAPTQSACRFRSCRELFQAGDCVAFTRVWQFMHTSVGGTAAWEHLFTV